MRWLRLIWWGGVVLLALVLSAITASARDSSRNGDFLHGSFDCRQDHDSLVAKCHFVVHDLQLDSLVASVDEDVLIYARSTGYLHPDFTMQVDSVKLRYGFDGIIHKRLDSDEPLYFCGLEAVGTDDWGTTVRSSETQMVRTFGLGLNLVPGIGVGYFDGDFGNGLAGEALAFSWEGEMFFTTDRLRVAVGTSQFGNWKTAGRKNFTEGIRLRSEYYPWADQWYRPFLRGGITRTTLTLKKNDQVYDKAKWGLMMGAGVRTPFERLDYAYTTCLGGYHTVGVTLAYGRWGPSYYGTRYEVTVHEKVATFRVQAVFDGLDVEGYVRQLDRHNNRFFLLKGLAGVAYLPWLPIVKLMEVTDDW